MGTSKLIKCILYVGFLSSIVDSMSPSERENSRVKRNIRSEQQRLRDLSPQDRPSCKSGATKPNTQVDTTARLQNLRSLFAGESVKGYFVPSEDAHQSEYTSNYDLRREYISGMSGSAGRAVILENKAALWTDGRYFLQAESELDCNWILMKSGEPDVPTETEWISANLNPGDKFGASPWLVRTNKWESFSEELAKSNIQFVQVMPDLVDRFWNRGNGRPSQPDTTINALPLSFAGKTWQTKVTDMQAAMASEKANVMVITGLDETAWLFNLRASDIDYNPFFLSYAILNAEKNTTSLYITNKGIKLTSVPTDKATTDKLNVHLNTGTQGSCNGKTEMCVEVKEYNDDALLQDIQTAIDTTDNSKSIIISHFCNTAISSRIPENRTLQINTPVALQKSQKNPTEREGMKEAHKRDAVALITFVTKLEREVKQGKVWTEVSAATELKKYREKQAHMRGLSFPSISSSGSNGAIIHYFPTNATDKRITTTEMYLLDSGGQYLDGTTDVTRTFHFGAPTDYQKETYTRVLMGQVNLASMNWLSNMYGREIDAIARKPLWDVGLNYRHGTGHGIGAYLSVHEGPGRISLSHSSFEWDSPLDEWQFFSDEPGYYEDGQFGIRLENIVYVKKVDTKYNFPGTTFLGFETITLVPYEPGLIKVDLLTQAEIDWINAYHKKVQDTIGPMIANDKEASNWLQSRTKAISKNNNEASSATRDHITTSLLAFMILFHLFHFLY